MELKAAFARVLRFVRRQRGLTQEDFFDVSSRTNISLLERGKTVPTLEKLEDICTVLDIHPVTMLALCYAEMSQTSAQAIAEVVTKECRKLGIQSEG